MTIRKMKKSMPPTTFPDPCVALTGVGVGLILAALATCVTFGVGEVKLESLDTRCGLVGVIEI